ncbi:MAG TPA: hypothetical protein VJ993_07890 [Woeseiaceae bacterium]|nr:hypothetical protein [Woeseiaceae bacterium]
MGGVYLAGIAALFIVVFGQLQAQGFNEQANEEIAEGRAMVRAGVDEIIREELALTAEEAELFWPTYAAYRSETRALMDRYTAMITEYMGRYDRGDLSDEYASDLMETFFSIKRDLLDVKMKYLPKFKKSLPALKVARFYQLENKIEAEIDAQLALAVPLIEPA